MPGNLQGNTWSHNSRKKAIGVFTVSVRRQDLVWRRYDNGNADWAYARYVKYNPRNLPVLVEGKDGFNR